MFLILDYDETYTEAPMLWDQTVKLFQKYGHTVVCCTMRMPDEDYYNRDVISDMGNLGVEIVYAAPHKDKWEAMQKAGYNPENAIWIDDRPMYIFMNRHHSEIPN